MRYFFRFIAPRRFSLLLICLASLFTCSAFASPVHAASQSKWKIVHSPKLGFFYGVAAFSSNNVWAVGNSDSSRSLIEHWNGSSWSAIPGPNPGFGSALDSVAVVAANAVWAVGTNGKGTLTEHWNGSSWTIVPSPSPDSSSTLISVAVVSANDVWAVGFDSSGSLIENWNGSSWTIVSSPNPGSRSFLEGVAVVAANDVWAVGFDSSGTLIENWNGSSWTIVPSPSPDSRSALNSVAVVAANDIWATGYSETGGSTGARTLTEHWNGSSWKHVPSPSPMGGGTIGDALLSISVSSTNNVWAVGYLGTGDGLTNTLIEHWNGTKWKVVSSPNPGDDSYLQGAAAVPGTTNVWAVGFYDFFSGPFHTLTEYYG